MRQDLSPNFDDRPDPEDVSLLVVHCISLPPKEFGGPYIEDLFHNRLDPSVHPYFETIHELKVSAHALIRRDGEVIQFVPFGKRAWHAGASSYAGRERCNDFSVGIELEGAEDIPYEEIQYQRLVELTKFIMLRYRRITPERITGHEDIAPGRKTDPGPSFDWDKFRRMLRQ